MTKNTEGILFETFFVIGEYLTKHAAHYLRLSFCYVLILQQ